MRSFLTYGAISLVGIAALYACGDDSGDGSTSTAGTGGQGGTAGTGGSSGGTSMSGAGGGAGASGGSGGAPSVPANCTGCVEIQIPFAAASQAALYQIVYPAPGLDFSNATITWAVQVLAGADPNLFVKLQIQNGAPNYPGYYNAAATALTTAGFPAGSFVNVTLNTATIPAVGGGGGGVGDAGADAGDAGAAPAPAGAFDKSKVEQLQIQFGSTAAFTGTQNLAVELDGVTITGVTGTTGATFAAGVEGLTLNNYPNSPTPVGAGAPVAH
jgi:hypothetical protein